MSGGGGDAVVTVDDLGIQVVDGVSARWGADGVHHSHGHHLGTTTTSRPSPGAGCREGPPCARFQSAYTGYHGERGPSSL